MNFLGFLLASHILDGVVEKIATLKYQEVQKEIAPRKKRLFSIAKGEELGWLHKTEKVLTITVLLQPNTRGKIKKAAPLNLNYKKKIHRRNMKRDFRNTWDYN